MARFSKIEEIEIWQEANALVIDIYKLTVKREFSKDFVLRDQIRKSGISIPSNIAEGFGRQSKKEFIKFLYYAKGSALELKTQINLARRLGYISQKEFLETEEKIEKIINKIGKLIGYLKRTQ